MAQTQLNFVQMGPKTGDLVVFIHGFAGDLTGWGNLQVGLSSSLRSVAFDLPGHGGSLAYPHECNAMVAAKAILADLEALGERRVHLVGHSLGGAVATLMGFKQPELVASLTLLAPGGFGPEINHTLLRHYAKARDVEQIHILLEQFFGWDFDVPKSLAEHVATFRQTPGALEAVQATADAILDGKGQKCLPTAQLASFSCPVKVIWGTQDRVLPTRQSHKLPGLVATHVFEGVGHMPHLECAREVLALIRQNVAAGQ
ncbi:MAG: alpha/beta fold hydrolase [Cohaesibacter sp.]|nr:alpha/beta fold hydrolase [Cohaesibacter sp.]MCV6600819.1 alpha/beta fold hydrolase [Cohaesibacter sp.]